MMKRVTYFSAAFQAADTTSTLPRALPWAVAISALQAERHVLNRSVQMIFFILCITLCIPLAASEQALKRIEAHFIIKDYVSAYEEAKDAVDRYPQSEKIHEVYIRSLAKLGNEKEMLAAWHHYKETFPTSKLNRNLVEEMGWGVLQKAATSSSLPMRQMALLAAFFSQEIHGVNILYRGMDDSNYAIRAIAVKLAGRMRDTKLIQKMKSLFMEERVWLVRKEVIEAIGNMKIVELRPQLESLIGSVSSEAQEKAVAITALLHLLDKIERNETVRLSSSNRAGLRLLACQAIGHFNSKRDLDQLYLLTKDPQADVRTAAFQSIGLLRPPSLNLELPRQGVIDPHYKVSIAAAWLLTLYAPAEGQNILERYLQSDKRETALLAAAALAATGRYGVETALKHFKSHSDPFVRLNLAIGLAGQQRSLEEVALVIEEVLDKEKERWNQKEWGIFHAYVGKGFQKEADPFVSPEMENQLIRLEIINVLAILKSPRAQQAAHQFLKERNWGISASAAALLLMEGDAAALDIVQNLLHDPDQKVRIQAALVLSLWSHEESAIHVLQQGYQESDKELKAKILEGIGRIGSVSSVPFLLDVLEEPSQTLRLISAMAIIQCLNH